MQNHLWNWNQGIYNKKLQILGNLLCRNMQVTKLHVEI